MPTGPETMTEAGIVAWAIQKEPAEHQALLRNAALRAIEDEKALIGRRKIESAFQKGEAATDKTLIEAKKEAVSIVNREKKASRKRIV